MGGTRLVLVQRSERAANCPKRGHLTQAGQTEAPDLSTGAASTQLEGLRLSWHVIGQSWPGAGLTVTAVVGALAVPCATRG